jgi:uncharacterized phage protein (TIGR02220 family)
LNYYPHHIGDFNNATRHLTRVERALYREMIELYYDTERPLPAENFDWICRKVLAQSQDERDAVKAILHEFFTLDNDVYRHSRCDREIAVYREKLEIASRAGKASAMARINGRSTSVKRRLNGSATNQEPITSNQEPITKENKGTVRLKPDALQVLQFLNSKTGRNFEPVDATIKPILARLREGASVDDCRAVIAKKCRDWAGDEKMNEYLRPKTLFNATNFANYKGELVAPQTTGEVI